MYAAQAARCAALLSVALAGVYLAPSTAAPALARLASAAALGAFWQQVAFVGHDTGHNSVMSSQTARAHHTLGVFVGNVLTGVSMGWWKATHNVHHVVCNSATHDPDIQHLPALCITPKLFNTWSTYHSRRMIFDPIARAMVRVQAYTFFPIMAIARINLYGQGLYRLAMEAKGMPAAELAAEVGGIAVFAAWLAALVAQVPTAWERAAFLLVAWGVTGLLHVQICSSHFSRPTFMGQPGQAAGSWVALQLNGTLDLACPAWFDWFHGGLQFQIEHHLFPRLPRYSLRAVKPKVKALAAKHGIAYHEVSFPEACREVLQTLSDCAAAAKDTPSISFFDSAGWKVATTVG